MHTTICFCPHCYAEIYTWGSCAISLYEDICEHFAMSGGVRYVIDEVDKNINVLQVLKYLEGKGCVKSIELEDNAIAVLPSNAKCQTYLVDEYSFCFRGSHD